MIEGRVLVLLAHDHAPSASHGQYVIGSFMFLNVRPEMAPRDGYHIQEGSRTQLKQQC
jgi:hypothetical protein